MERLTLPEQIPLEEEANKEKRIIRKPCQFLEEAGITNFRYEERDDGVHFFITPPPEHLKQKQKQKQGVLNAPEPTDFEAGPLHQFTEKLNQTQGLAWRFLPSQDTSGSQTELEILIFKAKKIKRRSGGYFNP